jgi:hypothetical protein
MLYWVVAAWILTVTDGLFALRPAMGLAAGRLAPTLAVTVGLAALLVGARRTAGLTPRVSACLAVVAFHAAGLLGFLFWKWQTDLRMVFNSVIWAGVSGWAALTLRRGQTYFWKSVFAPATTLWVHAAFHLVRMTLVLAFTAADWRRGNDLLQTVSDLEVSFFMASVFVGFLVAHLQLRGDQLTQARIEAETLSGLLPICAWCKKVRDDQGYWQQLEEYFSRHSNLQFTHGVCRECLPNVKGEPLEPVEPAPR